MSMSEQCCRKNAIIRRKFAMGSNLKAGKTVYVSSDNVYFFL
jgi:hypothetical protein